MPETMTGGQALAECLLKMGTPRVYGIVGTSNVAFVDALYEVRDRIRYVSCRHEQVAASMADAEGRLEGRPGVVLVHSGPGALNTLISAGNAYKDCSPMMIIAGAVKRKLRGSDGMLELDHLDVFRSVCKGIYRLDSAAEVTRVFSEAHRASMSGARGPVLLEVPEDVWTEQGDVDIESLRLPVDEPPEPDPAEASAAVQMLKDAQLPLILSGAGVAYSRSSEALRRLAEGLAIPVITTGNGRGTLPETHPLCLGRVGFGGGNAVADKAFESCDALLALGAGISDMTTYEFTLMPRAEDIVAVNISPASLAPQAPPARLVVCDVKAFLDEAVRALGDEQFPERPAWAEALGGARAMWEAMVAASLQRAGENPPAALVTVAIARRLEEDPVVSVGAGMHLLYPMAYLPCEKPLSFLSTVNFGSMGFGLAGSMAACLAEPGRPSLAFLGDGDFMMTMQDLETAVREGLGIKVFVLNDYQYRVLNVRQKLQFAGRIHGTEHGNPDFASLAECFGATGYRIDDRDRIDEVVESALAGEGPVVVDVIIDRDDMPPMNIEANLRMSAG